MGARPRSPRRGTAGCWARHLVRPGTRRISNYLAFGNFVTAILRVLLIVLIWDWLVDQGRRFPPCCHVPAAHTRRGSAVSWTEFKRHQDTERVLAGCTADMVAGSYKPAQNGTRIFETRGIFYAQIMINGYLILITRKKKGYLILK